MAVVYIFNYRRITDNLPVFLDKSAEKVLKYN
ncbi:hypothetical protein CHY_2593 [Carboxydothermus hydrogenoformans Z-2901]|uniref:Uncharacterized protein n=1 Tax=Carboxydothermus hydrogenoformans (strain ATCC BAA-161 / DSM 6008 / Z-2901) TaxID=246194 RepID=Q3A8Z8_CARHZ|nr:hypothetical protein CHY_2593 [Carboxydothermus hydrogenoformans Z-2901]